MAEPFVSLSASDRQDALGIASANSGRPAHLLEKDVWVVWALGALFESPLGASLVFKGGTSLSKAYGAIRRFSEDVDLTYDIRSIAPDLVGDNDGIPETRSQERKWSKEIKSRLALWVHDQALPTIAETVAQSGLALVARADGEKIFIDYESLTVSSGYVSPHVMLEFGARSTGEPWEDRPITCDAAPHLPGLEFPAATARVMRVERTFWEKATAIHVFCAQGRFRGGERFSRHWYDLARLWDAGYATRAIADRAVALAVAEHKAIFFAEKDADNRAIDYWEAISGNLQLIPKGSALTALAGDYRRMVDDGLLLDEADSFEMLIDCCRLIEADANAARTSASS